MALRWLGTVLGVTRLRLFDGPEAREVRRAIVGHAAFNTALSVIAFYLWALIGDRQPSESFVGFVAAASMISMALGVTAWLMQPADRTPTTIGACRVRWAPPPALPPPAVLWPHPDGTLEKHASVELIEAPWDEVVDAARDAVDAALGARLHSLYVRGSVPLGHAVEHLSDVDLIVVTTEAVDDAEVAEAVRPVDGRFGFVAGIDVLCVTRDEVMADAQNNFLAFLLATQAARVHGHDLTAELPTYALGPHAISHLPRLAEQLHDFVTEAPDIRADAEARAAVSWIMKNVIRSGFDLVMLDEGYYTRDLRACVDAFARRFPDQADQMHEALGLVVRRSRDVAHAREISGALGVWIAERA